MAFTAQYNALKEQLDSLPKAGDVLPEAEDKILRPGDKLSAPYLTAPLEDHGIPIQDLEFSDIINQM